MRGSPLQKISLLGGLDAEKHLIKEVFCLFLKNPRLDVSIVSNGEPPFQWNGWLKIT